MADAAALRGRRIAVTRPETSALDEALRDAGAEVVHVPLIAIAAPADGGRALRDALDRLSEFDWLVVTSVSGVRAVAAALDGRRLDVRLAAVGTATATALAAVAGREVDLVPDDQRGAGLVAAFPPIPTRVLVAQADRAAATVADGLRSAGHTVTVVTAYATVTRPIDDAERAVLAMTDAVVLASGSAVEAWRETGVEGPALVAIGPTTATAAAALGRAVDEVAAAPDPVAVVSAVVRALSARSGSAGTTP